MIFNAALFRPFQNPKDLPAALQFTGECLARSQFRSSLHPGDICHHLSNGLRGADPSQSVYLYEDEHSQIRSLAILDGYDGKGEFGIIVHPDLNGTSFEAAALVWCELALQAKADISAVITYVMQGDAWRRAALLAQGYSPADEPSQIDYLRSLQETLPTAALPDGFTIRSSAGEQDAEALSAVHSGSFGSSWPPGEYLKVMRTPGFTAEREWVVVAPDGRFAAFTIFWIDPVSRSGEFEPVGCHADFQRRGLTQALMAAVMRQMVALGMLHAVVKTSLDSVPANALYRSVGFRCLDQLVEFRKPIGGR